MMALFKESTYHDSTHKPQSHYMAAACSRFKKNILYDAKDPSRCIADTWATKGFEASGLWGVDVYAIKLHGAFEIAVSKDLRGRPYPNAQLSFPFLGSVLES